MEIILNKTIEKLGKAGDLLKVKDGYARNYLLPQGLAVAATQENMAWNKARADKRRENEQKERVQNVELAAKLEAKTLEITKEAGEEEKLFGSVTSQEIAKILSQAGFAIDKKQIHLDNPIKTLGNHEAAIKLSADVTAKLKLTVLKK